MSDDMIKGILVERKRQDRRKQQSKELIREIAEGVLGWGSLFLSAGLNFSTNIWYVQWLFAGGLQS